jgi:hypothetical protein
VDTATGHVAPVRKWLNGLLQDELWRRHQQSPRGGMGPKNVGRKSESSSMAMGASSEVEDESMSQPRDGG